MRTLANSRLGNSDYLCILGVRPHRSGPSIIMLLEALPDIGRAAETAGENQVSLKLDQRMISSLKPKVSPLFASQDGSYSFYHTAHQ